MAESSRSGSQVSARSFVIDMNVHRLRSAANIVDLNASSGCVAADR
jgi:hypothetical protein